MIGDLITDRLKNLENAVLSLAASNGAINRTEDMSKVIIRAFRTIRKHLTPLDIVLLNNWLGELTPEELDTFIDGEHTESMDIAANAPTGSNGDSVALVFEKVFDTL